MKALIFTFALFVTPATAQSLLPLTMPMTDINGIKIGTATFHNDRYYLRDLQGEHIATIVVEKDGSQTIFDPSGNIVGKRAASK
jgi:hypothetical protein